MEEEVELANRMVGGQEDTSKIGEKGERSKDDEDDSKKSAEVGEEEGRALVDECRK